jgi:hypothetical protein
MAVEHQLVRNLGYVRIDGARVMPMSSASLSMRSWLIVGNQTALFLRGFLARFALNLASRT